MMSPTGLQQIPLTEQSPAPAAMNEQTAPITAPPAVQSSQPRISEPMGKIAHG